MNKRPFSVTILSWLILLTGAFGLAYHLMEFKPQHLFQNDALWIFLLGVLAIVGGAFMLRGSNWARWLTLTWIAIHVIISAFHSLKEVAVHILLLAIFAYFLLRPEAARYFRHETPNAT